MGAFGALGLDFDDDYEVVGSGGAWKKSRKSKRGRRDNDGTTEAAEHRPKDRAKTVRKPEGARP